MENYLPVAAFGLLVVAFLIWRLRTEIRHKQPMGQAVTYLIYLVGFGIVAAIRQITPPWPNAVAIAVLVVGISACSGISYKIHRKYHAWLDAEQEKERLQEAASKDQA